MWQLIHKNVCSSIPVCLLKCPFTLAIFQRTWIICYKSYSSSMCMLWWHYGDWKSIIVHLKNLEEVLSRLQYAGMYLNALFPPTDWIPWTSDIRKRATATAQKLKAMVETLAPHSISQLKSFFGMIGYYSKFLPNLFTKLATLYSLLQKKKMWKWGEDQQQPFEETKQQLTSWYILAHYDNKKDLLYWHVMLLLMEWEQSYPTEWIMDQSNPYITFASWSLSHAERFMHS